MSHKNLISDPSVKKQIEILEDRKIQKCPIFNKVSYKTRQAAKKAAQYQSNIQNIDLYEYFCFHCNSWHLTKEKQ